MVPATKATVKVLNAFLSDPMGEQYGFGLMRATGVKSGSLYPILERLERIGWVEVHDEAIDERAAGRPKRRLYRLTRVGEREAQRTVAEFYRDLSPVPGWVPRQEGG